MFNSPRPAQRYGVSNTLGNGFGNNSFTADDPLAGSAYDGLDPWSSTPSPDLPPPPPPPAVSSSHFSSVIGENTSKLLILSPLTQLPSQRTQMLPHYIIKHSI